MNSAQRTASTYGDVDGRVFMKGYAKSSPPILCRDVASTNQALRLGVLGAGS